MGANLWSCLDNVHKDTESKMRNKQQNFSFQTLSLQWEDFLNFKLRSVIEALSNSWCHCSWNKADKGFFFPTFKYMYSFDAIEQTQIFYSHGNVLALWVVLDSKMEKGFIGGGNFISIIWTLNCKWMLSCLCNIPQVPWIKIGGELHFISLNFKWVRSFCGTHVQNNYNY